MLLIQVQSRVWCVTVAAPPLAIEAPPLAIQALSLAIQALPLEEESDDDDEFPPPAAPGRNGYRAAANHIFVPYETSEEEAPPPRPIHMNHRGVDENNVIGRANGRPRRSTASVVDRYVPSPPRVSKRRRREAFGNVTNRDLAQDED